MNALDKLQATIHPLKAKLKQHALYSKIQNIEDVRVRSMVIDRLLQ